MTTHKCHACGAVYPEAEDQTDPTDRETAIDSIGYVARNQWVCGGCLDEAEQARLDTPEVPADA